MSPPNTSHAEAYPGTVRSIAHKLAPPDTHRLTQVLQTTLELPDLLAIFSREVWSAVPHEYLSLQGDDGLAHTVGGSGRHRASYQLHLDNERLGEITIGRGHPFSERELATFEHLLCTLVYPLRNALRYRAAVYAASRDPLTGIGNRAALQTALGHEVELALRKGLPLALLAVDIDHFKKINDDHGHSIGDAVLRAVTGRIQHAIRSCDQAFRYGGEEFVVLLSQTERESALMVAERLRSGVAEHPIECGEGRPQVTVSVGVAVYEAGDDVKTLFDRADQALYRAKRAGRNRVEVFSQ